MAYLNDLEPVEWVEFEGGDVFVGFSERPPDWRPGDGPLLCEASVRMGALQQSCM